MLRKSASLGGLELHGPLASTDGRSAGADLDHGALDDIVDLLPDLLHLVLAVEVALHDLVSLDEPVQLVLQLVVLLREQALVTVQRVQLLAQVVVALDQGLVRITHALQVVGQGLDVQLQILNVLIGYSHSLVQVLILDDFGVLGPEESLLQLDGLAIRSDKLLHLILEVVDAGSDLVTVSDCAVELGRRLFKGERSLVDVVAQHLGSISELPLLAVEHLNSQLLLVDLLLAPPLVSSQLEDAVLLLLLDVVLVGDVRVQLLDVSAAGVVVETHLLELGRSLCDLMVAVVDGALHGLDLVEHLDALSLVVLDCPLHLLQVSIQVVNDFVLIANSVLVVPLARANLVLKAAHLPLQVCDDLLEDLEISLTSLVVLNLLSVRSNDAVANVVWARAIATNCGAISFKTAVLKLHPHKITVYII